MAVASGLIAAELYLMGRIDTDVMVWYLVPLLVAVLIGERRVAAGGVIAVGASVALAEAATAWHWPLAASVTIPSLTSSRCCHSWAPWSRPASSPPSTSARDGP